MNLGPTELLIFLLIPLLIVEIIAIIDLLRRPSYAFESAGVSRTLWLLLIGLGIFVCHAGFFVALWYFFMVSPKVRQAEKYGTGPGFPTTGNFPT